jgi:hypothetical protein
VAFALSQVQFVQAGAWDKIKDTSTKLGLSVKKDCKKAHKDAKKGMQEVADSWRYHSTSGFQFLETDKQG